MVGYIKHCEKISDLFFNLKRCVEVLSVQDEFLFSVIWNSSTDFLQTLFNGLEYACREKILNSVSYIQHNMHNLSGCADIIQEELIPALFSCVSLNEKLIFMYDEYRYQPAQTGDWTIIRETDNVQLHSAVDPMWEAWQKAKKLYKPYLKDFYILGSGLGYLPYCVWLISEESINIHIYEFDENSINYAFEYGVLGRFSDSIKSVQVGKSEDMLDIFFVNNNATDSDLYFVSEWVKDKYQGTLQESVSEFIENQKSVTRFSEKYAINYYQNLDKFNSYVSDAILEYGESDKPAYVLAAGPSLNASIEKLLSIRDDVSIFAVEGVLKKIVPQGLIPNYFAVIDPNIGTMSYIDDAEELTSGIALLAESLTYWKYINKYRGPKYRVLANDYASVKHECIEQNIDLWPTFKTVSTFAVECALRFGHREIHLVGLDLAYPGGKRHADGIGVDEEDLSNTSWKTRSNNGGLVATSDTFILFRKEIEELIRNHPEVRFINHSTEGAYIMGTYINAWWENIPLQENELLLYATKLCETSFFDWKEKYYLTKQIIRKTGVCPISVYDNVVHQFIDELNWNRETAITKGGIIYLLASHFDMIGDELSQQVLSDAYRLMHEHGRKILIINTGEDCGEMKVAVNEPVQYKYNHVLSNTDNIVYLGERLPYYQFAGEMPNIGLVQEFMCFIVNNPPEGIITYDRYSLLAEACKLIATVEYRQLL